MLRHTLRLGAIAAVLLMVPATASAAAGVDYWQGHKGNVSVSYFKPSGSSKLTGNITYECKLGKVAGTYTAEDLKGTAHGTSVTLKGSAYNTSGKSTVVGSLKKKGAKASLKVSYDFGDEDASTNCKFKVKKIKMKHIFTTGGRRVATAAAKNRGADYWQPKKSAQANSGQYVQARGSNTVTASVYYTCKDATGVVQNLSSNDLKGTAHGTSVTLKGSAYAGFGKATMHASLKHKGAKMSFSVSYTFPADANDPAVPCKVSKSHIKMKHSFALGG